MDCTGDRGNNYDDRKETGEPAFSNTRHNELVYLHTVKALEVLSIDNRRRHNNCLCDKRGSVKQSARSIESSTHDKEHK